jgi:hypothetical protein
MTDENKQGDAAWDTQMAEMERLSQRAAKLSERGAHYFVGWLIGAGMHKPAMMAEFEKVLTRLENDPELRHCWRDCTSEAAAAAPVETALDVASSTVSDEKSAVVAEVLSDVIENPAGVTEAPPVPAFEDHSHDHSRSGMVKFEAAPDVAVSGRQGFFGKIFRRPRVAA